MSEITLAVLRMPPELWSGSSIDIAQRHGRYVVAAGEIESLREEVAKLRTVMIAAADEIKAHWDAHCDAEGYGPVSLMRRLEEGIPAEYGYTAGRFAELAAEVERLRILLRQSDEQAGRWR